MTYAKICTSLHTDNHTTAHHSLNVSIKIKPVKGAEINLIRWQFVTDREYCVGLLCSGKL